MDATDDHEKTGAIDLGVVECACMCMTANWYVNGTGDRNTFIDSVVCITYVIMGIDLATTCTVCITKKWE